MPAFNHRIQEVNGIFNKLVIFRRTSVDNKSAPDPSDIKHVISMFKIENNILRRKNSTLPWNDYNNKIMEQRSIFQIGNDTNFVNKPNHAEISGKIHNNKMSDPNKSFYSNLEHYLRNSTLHGLKYVGDSSISMGERLFWLCSFLCAIGFAAYFISNLFYKFNHSPVIISVNPTPIPISSLPFPAITICNMNQARKNEAESIIQTGTDVERILLDDYCNLNTSFDNSNDDEVAKWLNVQKFMIQVSQPCPDMIKVCYFKNEERNCNFIFNSVLTDEGLCCTFNQLPRHNIFRNPREMSDLNLTYPSEVEDWNPERGYLKNASLKAIPLRAAGAGAKMGLTVVLDAAIDSYYCSSTSSTGFKVLLHNPIETPKMADFAFLLPPGVEARIEVSPKIYDSTKTLRSIEVEKRLCFFIEERQLRFYRSYTQRNCNLECQANYTLKVCNCVPYYLPKNRYQIICGKKEEDCVTKAKDKMDNVLEKNRLDKCHCLPGCFELNYQTATTYGKLNENIKIREKIIKNETIAYFKENMVVAHFFFVENQFSRNTKSEIYGFSEFLSNTGGLLGLFMGFSFLSAVEIAYYLSLRIFCCLIRTKYNKQEKQIKTPHSKHNASLVYPFAK